MHVLDGQEPVVEPRKSEVEEPADGKTRGPDPPLRLRVDHPGYREATVLLEGGA